MNYTTLKYLPRYGLVGFVTKFSALSTPAFLIGLFSRCLFLCFHIISLMFCFTCKHGKQYEWTLLTNDSTFQNCQVMWKKVRPWRITEAEGQVGEPWYLREVVPFLTPLRVVPGGTSPRDLGLKPITVGWWGQLSGAPFGAGSLPVVRGTQCLSLLLLLVHCSVLCSLLFWNLVVDWLASAPIPGFFPLHTILNSNPVFIVLPLHCTIHRFNSLSWSSRCWE